jgi:hypothetical protein
MRTIGFVANIKRKTRQVTRRTLIVALSCLLLASCLPLYSDAQTAGTGALTGIVRDPAGLPIVAAVLTLTNKGSGETRTVVSNQGGQYFIPLLLPGMYSLEVLKVGFERTSLPQVNVNITETHSLDIFMKIGTVSELVVVNTQVEQLQTESSTLGTVTTERQIQDLPLATRNYAQIIGLNPGVAVDVTDAGELGRGGLDSGVVSNGGWTSDNNYQMNGVGINDLESGGHFSGGVAVPNPDTIQEFKVQTSQYDASYGRNAGANVNLVTKGGTNEYHGSVWEYLRNEALNANTFFRNQQRQARPILKQNQFGFTFGGPIRKDKLQFFTSYQGTRQRNGLDVNCSSFVTEPALTNDRSAKSLGALFAGQSGAFGGITIQPDGSNINPVALALLQAKLSTGQYVIPTPQSINLSSPFDAQGSSAFSTACPYTEDQFMTNADYHPSAKSSFQGRFFFSNSSTTYTLPGTNLGGASTPGFPVSISNNFRNFSLSYFYMVSPTLFNHFEIGFHRNLALFDQHNPFRYSDIGATVPATDNNIPVIAVDSSSVNGLALGGNGQNVNFAQNTYTLQDSVSWVRGRHSFRFGGGLSREQINFFGFHFVAGEIFLTWPDFLIGLDGANNGTGFFSNVFGSIDLLGLFDREYRATEANGYLQDDIKVTQRLTVNLGIRYDRLGDLSDAKGRNSSFDPSLADHNPPMTGSVAGTIVPNNFAGQTSSGVLRASNDFGIKGIGQNTWNPRLGFAWRLPNTERIVLRGGYGVFHSRSTGLPFIQMLTAPPFAQLRQLIGPSNVSATEAVPFPLATPVFPAFIPYSPSTQNSLTFFDPRFRPPLVQQYSLGLQTQIRPSIVLEVAYSGARGMHLIRQRSINQADLASASNPIRGETTNTLTNLSLRVPYQGFSSSQMIQIESAGISKYNSLQAALNKRFDHGLQVQGSYTFSKDLTTDSFTSSSVGGGQAVGNQNSPNSRYGPDDFIRPHRLVVNFSYELPHPRMESYALKQAFAGWTVAGVVQAQSGHLRSVTFNNGASVYGTIVDRASLSGSCNPPQYVMPGATSGKIGNYINQKCFMAPPIIGDPEFDPNTGTVHPLGVGFGNSGVGILQGPGQFNSDLAILKRFSLSSNNDGRALEFRAEFFNAFNHPQFSDPDTEFTSPTFGHITATSVNPRIIQFALKFLF